ncbi:MAG: hypothetical protein M3014_14035 [Chloroflexota bacterium]|nr:hypothetical protein [Chloroflexota bacterium]
MPYSLQLDAEGAEGAEDEPTPTGAASLLHILFSALNGCMLAPKDVALSVANLSDNIKRGASQD